MTGRMKHFKELAKSMTAVTLGNSYCVGGLIIICAHGFPHQNRRYTLFFSIGKRSVPSLLTFRAQLAHLSLLESNVVLGLEQCTRSQENCILFLLCYCISLFNREHIC